MIPCLIRRLRRSGSPRQSTKRALSSPVSTGTDRRRPRGASPLLSPLLVGLLAAGCGTSSGRTQEVRVIDTVGHSDTGRAAASPTLSSRDILPDLIRAGVLLHGEEPEEGIRLLEQVLPSVADRAAIHERIALAYLRSGSAARGLPHADSAITLGGATPDRLMVRGLIRNLLWDDPGALADFDRVITLEPQNVQALQMSGSVLERIDPSRAIDRYHQILELTGEDAFVLHLLYRLQIAEERHAEIPGTLERLIALDRSVSAAWLPLALLDAGDEQEAIERLDRITLLPDRIERNGNLRELITGVWVRDLDRRSIASIERFAGRLVEKIDSLGSAETFPGSIVASAAILALRIDDRQRGARLTQRAIELGGLDTNVRYSLGGAALRNGMTEFGLLLLEVEPGSLPLRRARLRIFAERGNDYLRAGELDSALLFFDEAIRSDSLDGRGWTGLGRALYLRGERPQALEAFERGVAADPYDIEAILPYVWMLAVEQIQVERGFELTRTLVDEGEVEPALLEAYAHLAFLTGGTELAESLVWTLNIEENLSPFGYALWGDILSRGGVTEQGVERWREGLRRLQQDDLEQSGLPWPEAEVWQERFRKSIEENISRYEGEE